MRLRLDINILTGLFLLASLGLIILYSAANQNLNMVLAQLVRFIMAFVLMIFVAQLPPYKLKKFAPWFYGLGLLLLMIVLGLGEINKGAQRWLSLGLFRFQPSELMKLAVPLMLAWFLSDHELPPKKTVLLISLILIAIPAILTAKQPDLGTALIIAGAGLGVILLAGVRWSWVLICVVILAISAPFLWHHLHSYQQDRILIFLNPERDPLSKGYHIIQSKIAIGSGGIFGKGFLHGTQSHLQFLPEHTTDFIFAVAGEELGLMGGFVLIGLYAFLIIRGFYISYYAQDTFSRLLAGSISLTFFFSVFINMGMVTGILPVVGIPLPLISYGGTSMLTLIAGFGFLSSIQTHRRLVGK